MRHLNTCRAGQVPSFCLLIIWALMLFPQYAHASGSGDRGAGKRVILTLGAPQTADIAGLKKLSAAYKKVMPSVDIQVQAVPAPDYENFLQLRLSGGLGWDLMCAPSYAQGRRLFSAGFLSDCTMFRGLLPHFTDSSLAPWTARSGEVFAVPLAYVAHAVLYNKTIFDAEGLKIPSSWEDFLSLCAELAERGYTPLANGTADGWTAFEYVFLGLLPNFIGGASERVKYEQKEKKLNNASFIAAYQAVRDVSAYLPDNKTELGYEESLSLFKEGGAALFIDGTWSAGALENTDFEWGAFAIPAPLGKKQVVCVQPEIALSANTASSHRAEAEAFLTWLCGAEGAEALAESLSAGFFPLINLPLSHSGLPRQDLVRLTEHRETDLRFIFPELTDLYPAMNEAVISLMLGIGDARQAADTVAKISRNEGCFYK